MESTKINQIPKITTISNELFLVTDPSGSPKQVTMPNLVKSIFPGSSPDDIYDDIMILYYSSSQPRMARLSAWGALQSNGQMAAGVVLFSGEKQLVIAPNGSPAINWSSSNKTVPGGVLSSDRRVAYVDWKGEDNTAAIIAASASDFITNTATYAPGYCNLYSRVTADGHGIGEGKWWLPSLGELILIYANRNKINYALSLIEGSDPIGTGYHWSSTQYSANHAWYVYMSTGILTNITKSTTRYLARPVSALQ